MPTTASTNSKYLYLTIHSLLIILVTSYNAHDYDQTIVNTVTILCWLHAVPQNFCKIGWCEIQMEAPRTHKNNCRDDRRSSVLYYIDQIKKQLCTIDVVVHLLKVGNTLVKRIVSPFDVKHKYKKVEFHKMLGVHWEYSLAIT
jgi:hypothetical protein